MTRETSISRVNRPREQAKKAYDRISRWYDLFTFFERKYLRLGIAELDPKPGDCVLEIGFGTGHGLVDLARRVGPQGKVMGLDISDAMCRKAQKRLERNKLHNRAQLYVGDALSLPFSSASIDAVVMCFTLELFDNPEIPLVLNECARILRPQGKLAVVAMSKEGGRRSMQRIYEWAHRKFPNTVDCRPIYPSLMIQEAGYKIQSSQNMSMFGLGLQIVIAEKG